MQDHLPLPQAGSSATITLDETTTDPIMHNRSPTPQVARSSATNTLDGTVIDPVDMDLFMSRMLPAEDLYFPKDRPMVSSSKFERWGSLYSPYVNKCSGQVVPLKGCEWRFLRYDVYDKFKALSIDAIEGFVSVFVSIGMIGEFPLAYEASCPAMLSYLFYRFYAPFLIFVEGKATIAQNYKDDFLLRSEAEEKVTRKIARMIQATDDMASMERSVTPEESAEDNENLGGTYQRLEPRCCRDTLREGHRLVSKILQDYSFIKEVVFADLGAGMNLFPLYASAMFAWKSLGIEVVSNRVQLSANATHKLLGHEWFGKLRVGMFCKNLATTEDNWGGILCFLMWDKVFVNQVVDMIFRNIEASMTHDVVLIMSISTLDFSYRRQLMEDTFLVVEEGDKFSVSISSGGGGDTLKAFRLRRKTKVTDVKNIVDEFDEQFNTPNRKRSMAELEGRMLDKMKQSLGQRKLKQRKTK